MNKETKGTLLAVLTAIISGISIPANKYFIVTLDPLVFTAVRAVIIGAIFLLISSCISRSSHMKFRKVPWKYLIAIAIVGGSFAFWLFFAGLQLTTAGRAAFLEKSLPIYTAVLAFIFLKERVSRKMSIALLAMLIGTAIIYFSQITPGPLWPNPSLGDLLVIIATIMWATEDIISKKAMMLGETNFIISFARMFFGGLILFGVVILLGDLGALLVLSMQQWTNILISTALLFGYVLCWYWSLRYINVVKATSILLFASVISLVGGILAFGEPTPALQLIGSGVILIGGYFIIREKSEHRKNS